MSTSINNLSKYSIRITGLAALIIIYFFIWRTDAVGYGSVIFGDGNDYYSYLRAIFIDKNLGHQDTTPWYVIQTPTGTINVHTVGVSLLLLPFFLIGYASALMFGFEVNGVSEPFQKMISIGALFYALAGLYFIRKLLLKLEIRDGVIAIVLPLVFFGTNLLNYALNEPTMSHVYSFALISAFLYYSHNVFNNGNRKDFYFSALLLGLIVLVRPINAIIVLILPFWSNSFTEFISRLKELMFVRTKLLVSASFIFISTILIQSFVWLSQNGKMMQWSYKDNGMYLLSPNTFKMLFGFNSGFFIYTPLCLILMIGLVPLFRENTYKFYAMVFFLVFVFYLFSCHWAYTYFDGLSIRPMVDLYAVFAILGAKLISATQKRLATVTVPVFGVFVFLNLVTCYQYKAGILPAASMNYEKFKYIFLKTDPKYAGVLGGCNDLLPYAKKHPAVSFTYANTFDAEKQFDFSGKEFGVGHSAPIGSNTSKIFVKASLKRKEGAVNSSANALVVFRIESPQNELRNYQAYKLNDTPSEHCCNWQTWEYNVTMDGKIKADDILSVFIWNRNKDPFLIDDFKIEVYNYNYEQ